MGTFTQNSFVCDMGHYHDSSFTKLGLTENCHNVSSLLACIEKIKYFMHFPDLCLWRAKSCWSENHRLVVYGQISQKSPQANEFLKIWEHSIQIIRFWNKLLIVFYCRAVHLKSEQSSTQHSNYLVLVMFYYELSCFIMNYHVLLWIIMFYHRLLSFIINYRVLL